MKTKSITLIILMLAFLSIFSVNLSIVTNLDKKFDKIEFFKAEVESNIIEQEETRFCESSTDSLSNQVMESVAFLMIADFPFLLLQPVILKNS